MKIKKTDKRSIKSRKPNAEMSISRNRIFILLTIIYTIVLFFLGSIACFFSYQQKKEKVFSEMDLVFQQLEQEYTDTIDNFWQIYMPIFGTLGNDYVHSTLTDYFVASQDSFLRPLEKRDLASALTQMMIHDSQIQWIALYSEDRVHNYIMFHDSNRLEELQVDFPYLKQLPSGLSSMIIGGMEPINDNSSTLYTYALCGGIPTKMGNGKIIVGYSISSLDQICKNNTATLHSLNYRITSGQDILFDSGGSYEESTGLIPQDNMDGILRTQEGRRIYVHSRMRGNNSSMISYTVSWWELFRYAHSFTLPILLIVFFFCGISLILYIVLLKMITKEVTTIRNGLARIGENNLDYRIPTDFRQSGLPEIAASINHMTIRLEENINRAYYYELRQKEAELSELQAKFNPHFLYNSLEMLCSRCYQKGDDKTAELITQLAAIFRGFIGSKTFIPLQDELTFSKRYLILFGARYGERVKVHYDIDTELLQYGVIRNLFQPLIENYYIHGFDASEEDNYIRIRGRSLDEKTMMLSVEDNGCGMSDDEMTALNAKLQEPIQMDMESYGLKNLHQRLQLFYGGDCGLKITQNQKKGTCFEMIMLKMTCEEYEKQNLTNKPNKGKIS